MKQLRFKITCLKGAPRLLYAIPRANYYIKHWDKYGEEKEYSIAIWIIETVRKLANVSNKYYGLENLPKEGGYTLYSNHQGKYDALGILLGHQKPISILWERKTARKILARQINGLVRGQTIDFNEKKEYLSIFKTITNELKEGRRYLIFPEGKYEDNKNSLLEFQSGCFISSISSETPVVPVCIYNSYRAMDLNTFGHEETEVHFLKPIMPEEYKGLNRKELCALVKKRIQDKLTERINAPENQKYKEKN